MITRERFVEEKANSLGTGLSIFIYRVCALKEFQRRKLIPFTWADNRDNSFNSCYDISRTFRKDFPLYSFLLSPQIYLRRAVRRTLIANYIHTRLQFFFALAVVAARASHFSSLEGHGLHSSEPKLISQSVHLKEIPTKIIKVTKTAVVKVPVPYPVKVFTSIQFLVYINFTNPNSTNSLRHPFAKTQIK